MARASHIRQTPPVDLLVKSWTGWHSRLRLPRSSCPDSSCLNPTKESNQTVGREPCGCGCLWVTILGLHQRLPQQSRPDLQRGRRRQLPPRREFPPPLIFLLDVNIIHTNKPATALLFGPSHTYRACHSRWARLQRDTSTLPPQRHAVAIASLGRDASPDDAITCCIPHFQAAFIVTCVLRCHGQPSSPISLPSTVTARDEVRSRVQGDP